LFLSCACVSVSGVLFSVGVCVCDLLIFSIQVHELEREYGGYRNTTLRNTAKCPP